MSIGKERISAAGVAGLNFTVGCYNILAAIDGVLEKNEIPLVNSILTPMCLGVAATFSLIAFAPNKDKQ